MEPSKSIFASKTFWINMALAILAYLQTVVSADVMVYIIAAINILNRFLTTKPVHVV